MAAATLLVVVLLPSTVRGQEESLTLTPAYREGERTRVEQIVAVRLRIDVPSSDRERVLVVQQEKRQTYVEDVLAVADGARTRVRRTYLVDRESARTGDGVGGESATTSDLEGRSIVIEGSGTDVTVAADDGGPIASQAGLDLRDLSELIPRRPLEPGESFDVAPDLVAHLFRPAGAPPREASCHLTFVGRTPRGGEDCARFALELHLVEGDEAEQVTLHGSGDIFYTLDAGRPWALDLSGRLEMTGRRGEQTYGGAGEITYRMAASRPASEQTTPVPPGD